MLRTMSCPSFYSENASDYVAVGSTVTGNSKLFWVISLQDLDKIQMDSAGMPGTQQSYPPLRRRNCPGASENPNFA